VIGRARLVGSPQKRFLSRSSKRLGAGSWRLRVAGEQHGYTTRYSTSRADLLVEQVTSRHSTSRAPSSWALRRNK
jgi:hypothetical protein